ncbi:MAG: hypothetical protein UF218_08180, partial [Eggerthellaceae bacterium]|nr:hypothetical protein [Eggerthellaceae bacterium]
LQRYQSAKELKTAFMQALPDTGEKSVAATPSIPSAKESLSTSSTSSIEKQRVLGNETSQGRIIIGVIWDVVVILVLALFIYGCVFSAMHPSETQAQIPMVNLGVASAGLGIMFVGIALVLFDVKPFVLYVSVLKKYTITKRLIIGLSVAVGGFLIMVIALGLAALA